MFLHPRENHTRVNTQLAVRPSLHGARAGICSPGAPLHPRPDRIGAAA